MKEKQNIDTEMVHTVEATLDSTSLDNSSIKAPVATSAKLLPFEFRALEACLESACECLESQVVNHPHSTYVNMFIYLNIMHIFKFRPSVFSCVK